MHIGGLVILERMSLSVPKGKIVSLIGPNGAGRRHRLQHHHRFYEADERRSASSRGRTSST